MSYQLHFLVIINMMLDFFFQLLSCKEEVIFSFQFCHEDDAGHGGIAAIVDWCLISTGVLLGAT